MASRKKTAPRTTTRAAAARKQAPRKPRIPSTVAEAVRQHTVVLEQIHAQNKVFGEGQQLLVDRVDRLQQDVTLLKEATLENRCDIKELRSEVAEHGQLLAEHGTQLRAMRVEVHELAARKVDRDEVEAVVERVLERRGAH